MQWNVQEGNQEVTFGEAAEVETCEGNFIYFLCVNVNEYKETLREL